MLKNDGDRALFFTLIVMPVRLGVEIAQIKMAAMRSRRTPLYSDFTENVLLQNATDVGPARLAVFAFQMNENSVIATKFYENGLIL